ncbi:MAG: hypothetical protein WDN75_20595 [Bacteroidota bacterium]
MKILILANWRLFGMKKREDYCDKVREGQYIQIRRTGTHRLIGYYVYDRKPKPICLWLDASSACSANMLVKELP